MPEKSHLLTRKALLYKKPDTTQAAAQTVAAGDKILLIGSRAGFAVVRRTGFIYYVPDRYIAAPLAEEQAPRIAKQVDSNKGTYYYTETVTADGISKTELYRRARKWVATAYRSAQDVIQLDDAETGELLMKGSTKLDPRNQYVRHMLTISVKDGKFRYDIRNFVLVEVFPSTLMETPLEKPSFGGRKRVLEQSDEEVQRLIRDLKEAMLQSTKSSANDW